MEFCTTGCGRSPRRALLAIDEVGYLSYDAHAADLLFQVVSRRYEQKSLVITTNRIQSRPYTVSVGWLAVR